MKENIEKYINPDINPGDDFFKFATDNWLKYHKWNKMYPSWGCFAALNEKNAKRIEQIITHPNDTEISKKITALYNISMDYDRRNKEGNKPLLDYLNAYIYPIKTKEDIFKFCAKNHITPFFDIYIDADAKHPDDNIVYMTQSGLTLDNKDYYMDDKLNDNILKIREAFKKFAVRLFMYIGYSRKDALQKFTRIWEIEKDLAWLHYPNEDRMKPELTYHLINVPEISKLLHFDLHNFLVDYGFTDIQNVVMREQVAILYGCNLMNKLSVDDIKLILEWNLMMYASKSLDDKAYKINSDFNDAWNGKSRNPSKKRRSINLCNAFFGESIGELYIKKYFDENSKKDVIGIVYNLIDSFKDILQNKEWLSEETKQKAIEKLSKMNVKIGYPDKIEDYSDCPIDEKLSLFENRINMGEYFFWKNFNKNYNKKVDKGEWHMNPQTINAYYSQHNNEICFPAGILQFPFYDKNRKPEFNYGAIGVIIGHEMTHGYDNHGRQFNENAELAQWWKDDEIKKFNELAENTLNHFKSLDVLPDLKCNASLTLSENLADYGGLKIAYNACDKICDNDEWKKSFFISYALCWAGIANEEFIRNLTLNNEHSINYIRVNGTLPLFDKWYEAFGITDKDKLYIPEDKRALIW